MVRVRASAPAGRSAGPARAGSRSRPHPRLAFLFMEGGQHAPQACGHRQHAAAANVARAGLRVHGVVHQVLDAGVLCGEGGTPRTRACQCSRQPT